MADEPLRVFLASPGDVAAERAFVWTFLETILPKDPLLRSRPVAFDVVAWDHPAAGTPLPARISPQEAVIRFKRRPADCDIVIVILSGRMGTHLDTERLAKADRSAYVSGTEWEYLDAFDSPSKPEILVYTNNKTPPIERSDPDRTEKMRQWALLDAFLGRFRAINDLNESVLADTLRQYEVANTGEPLCC